MVNLDKKEVERLATSTPMMRKWWEIKSTLNGEIVFCRVGDFYELFFDDAIKASKLLDIQLTRRKIQDTTYPMAGVPVRSLENYIARLIEMGQKVAIIDQLEDAKQAKGTVKRGLTRIITAGTVIEDTMLLPGRNNYLAAICHRSVKNETEYGFSVCDLSTGDFRAGTFSDLSKNELLRAFSKYSPVEILYQQDIDDLGAIYSINFENEEITTPKPDFWFDPKIAKEIVFEQFKITTTQGYGLSEHSMGIAAAGAIIKYLQETQFTQFPHLSSIKSLDVQETMMLDLIAIKSLELFENTQDHSQYATLLELMDETVTPMGGRLLRHWIANPLANKSKIEKRLGAVSLFQNDPLLQHSVRSIISEMGDIERLITRISMGSAKPDELNKLATSLEKIPDLRKKLESVKKYFPTKLISEIDPCLDIVHLIRKTIREFPDTEVGAGRVIKRGYNSELDRLSQILENGENWLDEYIIREIKRTNMLSIKVKQNNHLGYFLEITKKDLPNIPEYFIRKQAMVNSARFFTEELKEWETDILESELNILGVEKMIYIGILKELSKFVMILQTTGQAIAQIDCLSSFAHLAERRNYCKPAFHNNDSMVIKAGRHPVIEAISSSQEYVPNDIVFDTDSQNILIITGPNFSGKSSLLRATALISIMAHMGSFVPANELKIGIIDRIFTRIGASDNLVAGQSTFMMEMIDAANLVNNSTSKSLVIADELGRGTSTYDGLAIAWSIAEYLHNKTESPKTMIATHYHQLSELEDLLHKVKNFQFAISFVDGAPVFDHKLDVGSSDKSFGVEVARLAGLPKEVIERGRTILEILESKATEVDPEGIKSNKLSQLIVFHDNQASLDNWFSDLNQPESQYNKVGRKQEQKNNHPVLKKLLELNPEKLSPLEALNLLVELRKLISNDKN